MNITHAIAVHMYIYWNLEKESSQEGGLRKGVRRLGVSRCLKKGTPLTKAFQNWIGEAPRSRKKDGAKPVVAADKGSYRHSFPDCGVFPWSIAKYLASGPAASTVEWSIELLNCSRNLLLVRVESDPLHCPKPTLKPSNDESPMGPLLIAFSIRPWINGQNQMKESKGKRIG